MNDWTRFIDFEEGDGSEFIYTGDTKVMIEGTGTIIVRGRCLDSTEATLTLNNVLYISTFHMNIVSLTRAYYYSENGTMWFTNKLLVVGLSGKWVLHLGQEFFLGSHYMWFPHHQFLPVCAPD